MNAIKKIKKDFVWKFELNGFTFAMQVLKRL